MHEMHETSASRATSARSTRALMPIVDAVASVPSVPRVAHASFAWGADAEHPIALWLRRSSRLRTRAVYAHTVDEFARWLRETRGGVDVLDASVADALAYTEHLSASDLRSTTIAKKLAALSALYGFLMRVPSGVTHNPFEVVDAPALNDVRIKRAWTFEEVGAFFAAIPHDGALLHLRDRALFKVLFGNGPRVGELLGANVGDLTLVDGYHVLYLREHSRAEQHLKTGARRLVLKRETADVLLAYLRARGFADGAERVVPSSTSSGDGVLDDWRAAPLFEATRFAGRPTRDGVRRAASRETRLSTRSAEMRMRVYGARAGIDADLCHPHIARHTVVSTLIALGVDLVAVQQVSGHKTLASVQRYAHAHQEVVRNAALRVPY